ncbi:MAG: hypothetical protein KJO91_09935 [Gammaproteobacteria bacterium]|nr:hypothetical protein [Gammaproteobacteria bacterium]
MSASDWSFTYIGDRLVVCQKHENACEVSVFNLAHAEQMQREILDLKKEIEDCQK